MIAFLQRKSTVSFALVYSLTYFGSRFNSPKETRYRPLKQKMPSFIPQCSLFQGEPRLYSARECLARFTCLVFVCLWQFLICFKAFITFWYNTKNTITTCIFQRVITLLVQGTSGEENYSFSEFFYLFWMSGQLLSSSTEVAWPMLVGSAVLVGVLFCMGLSSYQGSK